MRVEKGNLDERIARKLGIKRADVAKLTRAFVEEILWALVEKGEVTLRGLCTLRVKKGREQLPSKHLGSQLSLPIKTSRVRVHCTKSQTLDRELRRRGVPEKTDGEVRSRPEFEPIVRQERRRASMPAVR